jgi:dolichol kinase
MLAIIRCTFFCLEVCYQKNLKVNIYRTIILTVVLYGCEIWSLTLRKERRLRVFENRVLRRIFGPKRDEVTT